MAHRRRAGGGDKDVRLVGGCASLLATLARGAGVSVMWLIQLGSLPPRSLHNSQLDSSSSLMCSILLAQHPAGIGSAPHDALLAAKLLDMQIVILQ